jgi:2,5-diketo-D-gluconate reductase A
VSTRKLGLDTVDLYLLHQPPPQAFDLTVAAYRAAERLLAEGRARAIGVSNFSISHLQAFLPQVDVVPAVNQVEVHPYYNQPALRAEHLKHGIATQAWSPLGGVHVDRASDPSAPASAMADPVVMAIAEGHGRTPAQVLLRWHIDGGRSAIPKSVRSERIAENLDVFGFRLTADELAAIDALDTGERGGPNQDAIDFRTFNRVIPEA